MENLIYYKSKYNVNFSEDFILSFDSQNFSNDDFDFILKFPLIEFKITNLPPKYNYISDSPNELYITKVHDEAEQTFLDDEYIIVNDDVFIAYSDERANDIKNFFYKNNKIYIKVDDYKFSKDKNEIVKKLYKTSNNKILKPICIEVLIKLDDSNSDEYLYKLKEYFYKNTLFDTNIKNSFRIVVSDNCQQLSFFIKEGEKYKKIKDFSFNYENKKSEGAVYFAINKNMEISNLNVSFLEA